MDSFRMKLRVISRYFFQLTRRHKRNIRFVLCTVVVTLAFHRGFHYMYDDTSSELLQLKQTKLILVYTPFPYEPWGPKTAEEAKSYKFSDWDGTPCEESRCQITFKRSLLNASDAVLFHSVALSSLRDIEELTRNRLPTQRWVLYAKESPGVLPIGARYNGLYFNWTATYRRDSDFFVPYGYYTSLAIQSEPAGEEAADDTGKVAFSQRTKPEGDVDVQIDHSINYAGGKDKMAVFGTSQHCGGHRYAFVRALMKHVRVSVFGKCATQLETNSTWRCPHNMGNGCLEEFQRHKFYLAVENSLCLDYITEKYWRNSLERGLVPIVLGGTQYSPELLIPGSFIDAADFDSVKDLADYLKYLDKTDTAYNQYFQWKTKYKVVKYQFWLCQLCKALHDSTRPAKTYHKISDFWGVKGSCGIDKERILDIINRG